MKTEEITQQILEAWDEIAGEDQPTDQPEPEETLEEEEQGAQVETPDQVVEEESPEEGDEESVEESGDLEEAEPGESEEAGEEEEEPEVEASFESDDPEIQSFLSKFQGDVERALRYGAQAQRSLSDVGQQRAALSRRVAELEGELAQAQAFSDSPFMLSEEQRTWVAEATESGNPNAYIREAVRAGEFALARAVAAEWGREDAYSALRASQAIDNAERESYTTIEEQPASSLPVGELIDILVQNFPEMPQYEQQMLETFQRLGDLHPTVQDARSPDPQIAARGIINIYEIARSSTHALKTTRSAVKDGSREEATTARKRAVVASAAAAPSPGQSPRNQQRLGPGLTLEQLDAEFERESGR